MMSREEFVEYVISTGSCPAVNQSNEILTKQDMIDIENYASNHNDDKLREFIWRKFDVVKSLENKISEAMNKISNERAEQIDAFVVAILKVRQENENLDMNYIALEHSNDFVKGKHVSRVKVVYLKGAK